MYVDSLSSWAYTYSQKCAESSPWIPESHKIKWKQFGLKGLWREQVFRLSIPFQCHWDRSPFDVHCTLICYALYENCVRKMHEMKPYERLRNAESIHSISKMLKAWQQGGSQVTKYTKEVEGHMENANYSPFPCKHSKNIESRSCLKGRTKV